MGSKRFMESNWAGNVKFRFKCIESNILKGLNEDWTLIF